MVVGSKTKIGGGKDYMVVLQDFRQKDMIEQITLLEEVRQNRQVEAIPALFDLYLNAIGDQAVDEMVYHALYELLAGQQDEIIEGLSHSSSAVQVLCARRAADEKSSPDLRQALVNSLKDTADADLAGEILRALSSDEDPSLRDIFMSYIGHDEATVAVWAMSALVKYRDSDSRDALLAFIADSEDVRGKGEGGCDLRVAKALESLAYFVEPETIDFLAANIHHPNPSFRSVVNSTLASMGEAILPSFESILEKGDKDEKIMAANILGIARLKAGADILVGRLEETQDLNLKFAIYEALGRITSLRSVVGLTDGLAEQDELVLIAVVTSLDNLCNPGVVKVVSEALGKGDAQSKHVARAIVACHARELFAALYVEGSHVEMLLEAVQASSDRETIGPFPINTGRDRTDPPPPIKSHQYFPIKTLNRRRMRSSISIEINKTPPIHSTLLIR